MKVLITILLLCGSNFFMTFAWHGHLKKSGSLLQSQTLLPVILVSWGIALFEYCLMVPANRIGYSSLHLHPLCRHVHGGKMADGLRMGLPLRSGGRLFRQQAVAFGQLNGPLNA